MKTSCSKTRLLSLLCLLLPVAVRAEDPSPPPERWGVLLSAGGGLFGEPSGERGNGYLLSAHVLASAPVGLEFGLVIQQGATSEEVPSYNIGETVPRLRPVANFRSVGAEVRYRFARDRIISPWLGARASMSNSWLLDYDAGPRPKRFSELSPSIALGLGGDVRIYRSLGLVLSGYWQRCDMREMGGTSSSCRGEAGLLSFQLAPRIRL